MGGQRSSKLVTAATLPEDDLEIAGEASDGEEAVAVTRRLQPDVVLMDIQMSKLDGLEAARRIGSDAAIRATSSS